MDLLCTSGEVDRISACILQSRAFTQLRSGDRAVLLECEIPDPLGGGGAAFDAFEDSMWAELLLLPCTAPPGKACLTCGKEASQLCGACCAALYCSEACQRSHWKTHKPSCKGLAVGVILGGRSREGLVAAGGHFECLFTASNCGSTPHSRANARGISGQVAAAGKLMAKRVGFSLLHTCRVGDASKVPILALFVLPQPSQPQGSSEQLGAEGGGGGL